MKPLKDNIEELQAALRTERFGRQCRWFDTVESTNPLAFAWAGQGAPTGALIVADFQEKGRGRFNRTWTAEPGRSLTFSLVVDPDELRPDLGLLSVAVPVAVAEAIGDRLAPHRPLIKWPNDVILAGKKVCGILIESSLPSSSTDRGGRVVAGIGINVNQDRFPEDIEGIATSIYRVLGRQVDRIELLADILFSIESVYEEIRAGRHAELIRRYETAMFGLNETVRFTGMDRNETAEGSILGVDSTGGLRVQLKSGIKVLRAGEVTVRSESAPPQAQIARLPDKSMPTSPS